MNVLILLLVGPHLVLGPGGTPDACEDLQRPASTAGGDANADRCVFSRTIAGDPLFERGLVGPYANAFSDTGYVDVDGTRLRYVVEGEGPTTLVIGSSIYYPKTFSKNLRNHLRMIFVDMKWFVEEYEKENLDLMTIDSIAEDLEAIRSELRLDRPILIGHSIHGTIAMEYAKRYPENISGLVIIGSPSLWGNDAYREKAAALWETASEERKDIQEKNWGEVSEVDRLTGKDRTAAEYNRASPQYWYDPTYDAGWLWDGMTVHTELTDHLFQTVFWEYDMFESSPRMDVPVLVAMGLYDYVIPHTLWEGRYDTLEDYTLVLFERSGHTPQLEESELFDQTLVEWLEGRQRDRSRQGERTRTGRTRIRAHPYSPFSTITDRCDEEIF